MRSILLSCVVALLGVTPAAAQDSKPLKIGVIEDMSGVYADITGPGAVTAAELAIADFGPASSAEKSNSSAAIIRTRRISARVSRAAGSTSMAWR